MLLKNKDEAKKDKKKEENEKCPPTPNFLIQFSNNFFFEVRKK